MEDTSPYASEPPRIYCLTCYTIVQFMSLWML